MRAFFGYISPDFGQPLRVKGARAAHDAVLQFLQCCTDAARGFTGDVELEMSEGGPFLPEDFPYETAILRAISLFGQGKRDAGIRNITTGATHYKYTWILESGRLPAALDFFDSLPPLGTGPLSPVTLTWQEDFLLIDPATREVLPFQGPAHIREAWAQSSSVMVYLGHQATALFELVFPFEVADEVFGRYLKEVVPQLPVKFAWQALRMYRPTKKGTGYIKRRLAAEDLAKVREYK